MKAIGFRVEPKAIHWALVEGTADDFRILEEDKFVAVKTFTEAQALSYYRDRVINTIHSLRPDRAAVRYPESFSRGGLKAGTQHRLRIEGVILEALYTENIPIFGGALASIGSRLGSKKPKAYIEGSEFRTANMDGKSACAKEAILVAVSALGG